MVLAEKHELRSKVQRIEKVKTWQLFVALVMVGFISATFLRLNNVGMIERRDAVYAADESGNISDLEKRLYDLQRYVSEHMNTDTGLVPLENSYKAVYDRELKKFESTITSQSSNDVIKQVRQVCDSEAISGGYGRFQANADPRYVACINREWGKYPSASQSSTEFTPPSPAPYYQTFASPSWSPDFAGWSLLVCGVILVMIIARLTLLGILKLLLYREYRRV